MSNNLLINEDNISVNYQKASINNTFDFKPSLDEIYTIFKNDADSIFSYNTADCITFILKNNEEIPLYQYKSDIHKPIFLKIWDQYLKKHENEIIISLTKNHYISANCIFHNDVGYSINGKIPPLHLFFNSAASNDYNGFKNSKNLYQIGYGAIFYAPNYCIDIEIQQSFKTYAGYLPAAGQLLWIYKYLDIINYILKNTGTDEIKFLQNSWWTSTAHSNHQMWIINKNSIEHIEPSAYIRCNILPLFKRTIKLQYENLEKAYLNYMTNEK